MIIPTGSISSAGARLADVAAKMDGMARQAKLLRDSIGKCFYGAGVGDERVWVAASMTNLAEQATEKSSALATAAVVYEKAETELVNHAKAVGRNIDNGYNYAWISKPEISAIIDVAPVVVTPSYRPEDFVEPKPSFREHVREKISDIHGGVVSAIDRIKANYNNHGRVYDAVQYGKAAIKCVKGGVKIVGAVTTVGGAFAATAATGGAAAPLTLGSASVALTEIISGGNDIINGVMDGAYVYTDQYEVVGTRNALRDYLAQKGRETGEMLGNAELGEMLGKGAYTTLDIYSFGKGVEKLGDSFGLLNTDLTGRTGYSPVLGETSYQDLFQHEIKMTSTSGVIRNILGWSPASTTNLLYEVSENAVSLYQKGTKMVKSIMSVFS